MMDAKKDQCIVIRYEMLLSVFTVCKILFMRKSVRDSPELFLLLQRRKWLRKDGGYQTDPALLDSHTSQMQRHTAGTYTQYLSGQSC